MTARKGFAEAKMRLRKSRFLATIEITSEEEDVHDILDEWQSLYPPPQGADPFDMELLSWEPLPKPLGLPDGPIKPGPRTILIWRSEAF